MRFSWIFKYFFGTFIESELFFLKNLLFFNSNVLLKQVPKPANQVFLFLQFLQVH